MPDANYLYRFEFEAESTEALVSMITNADLIIDGDLIPAETTIYELYLFCNRYTNISAVAGMGLDWLYWPGEEDGQQGKPPEENITEQTEVSTDVESVEGGEELILDNVIEVSSDINANQIWTANNTYHITANISVRALLVIEPGTTIKFASGKSMSVNNGGTLISSGTPDNPIIYTSDSLTPDYNDYNCPILIEETASASTRATYNYIAYANTGIKVFNKRLDNPIENNYFYRNYFGIREYGIEHTDIINNLVQDTYNYGIDVNMASATSQGSAESHILIQNNTCDDCNFGIIVRGVINDYDAGEVTLTNNIVSNSRLYGLALVNGWMYFTVSNTGYYGNAANKYWDFEEYNPVIETVTPYVSGTGILPDFYLRYNSAFVNASDEYIEQTRLIGKTTDINSFPDSNIVDLGFHYPNWSFSNAGDGNSLTMDLYADSIVNFKDFAVLATDWQTDYNINDLNTMADEWLKYGGPNIQIQIDGDLNNLAGVVTIGISGRDSSIEQGFIYVDGEPIGNIDYRLDPETTSEYVLLDTFTIDNGSHEIKAAVIDTNGFITVSQKISVTTNNAIYYFVRANNFNQGEDYYLYAMNGSSNDLRVKLYNWDGTLAWTSASAPGNLNLSIPGGTFTGEIYNMAVEAYSSGWQEIWEEAIGKKYDINGNYKVQVFLPNGLTPVDFKNVADSRQEAVAELVRWSRARGFTCAVWYLGQANWKTFSTQVTKTSTKIIYIVSHGYGTFKYKGVTTNRLNFVISSGGWGKWFGGTEYILSHKEDIPDANTDSSVHSLRELGLAQSNHLKIIYHTACRMGESDEMAREWINLDMPLDQIFISFEYTVPLFSPNWQLWDYQVWNQWGDGQTTWFEVFDYCSRRNPDGTRIAMEQDEACFGYPYTKFK